MPASHFKMREKWHLGELKNDQFQFQMSWSMLHINFTVWIIDCQNEREENY